MEIALPLYLFKFHTMNNTNMTAARTTVVEVPVATPNNTRFTSVRIKGG